LVPTGVPVPPNTSIFSETFNFTYEDWTVDFIRKVASVGQKRINLQFLARNPIWYYSQVPNNKKYGIEKERDTASAFIPFPITISDKITNASKSNMPAYKFTYVIDKSFFFGKTVNCIVNFGTRIVRMSDGGRESEHVFMSEYDMISKIYWEPKIYNTPIKQKNPSQAKRFDYTDERKELDAGSPEWKLISDYFYLTMPKEKDGKPINRITKILRYQNLFLIDNYEKKLQTARDVHHNIDFRNSIKYQKLLWHGTGNTNPNIIADGGWKINYAGDKNLWGGGTYFASDASYSASYAYEDKNTGNKQIFLAKVITGLGYHCPENKNIKDIPKGYNSIVGWRHGSWIYVVYDNFLACPWYLVEWAEK